MKNGIQTEPYGLRTVVKRPIHVRLESNMRTRAEEHKIEFHLGCEIDEFMWYISSKFRVGMCWRNYGVKWELDHIIPVSFVFRDEFKKMTAERQTEVKQKICHWTNIQPLFNCENAKKRASVGEEARLLLGG